ncbi:hypothetical protein [Sphingomonas abietis]|uniref:ANTAR domain-containing protein n=1 Tax=Sphingomonas abietis TaxID=3012344 RepID=A0ABY7NVT7_9SPHN|nr:hypothetical protein [Sphingomonas abietis]WBO23556.1 hypothetical protein PBT88_05350 [Sphingomonas abietis]
MSDIPAGYTLATLVEDLRHSYRDDASRQALSLMVAAKRRGLMKERDILTAAAIMLCRRPAAVRSAD